MQKIFDHTKIDRNKTYAFNNLSKADFIIKHVQQDLMGRLGVIKRQFDSTYIHGALGGYVLADRLKRSDQFNEIKVIDTIDVSWPNYDQMDHEILNLEENSLDCFISILDLHRINDLPGFLLQIKRTLKPDGLFLGTLFGGESLYDLRHCFYTVEENIYQSVTPHIHPFIDKQQMGALMQRAGFALPVIDSETLTVNYPNVFKLFTDLKNMGERNALIKNDNRYYSKAFFEKVNEEILKQKGQTTNQDRIDIEFEIINVLGWAPADNQQKPMTPGSGEKSLTEVL